MVCSACGNGNPAGNRFCGMCGASLEHRPPGALDARDGVVDLASEQSTPLLPLLPHEDAAPENTPLRFAEDLEDPPHVQALEAAVTDEAPAAQSEIPVAALSIPPSEANTPAEVPDFPWMDDVMVQIESELAKSSGAHDKPHFLDGLSLPEPESEPHDATPEPVAPVLNRPLPPAAISASDRMNGIETLLSSKWRIWLVTAAVLVFTVLAVVVVRSQRNHTGPLHAIKHNIQALLPSNHQNADNDRPETSAGSAENTTSKQPRRTAAQSASHEPSAAATTNPPATTTTGPETTRATPAATTPQAKGQPPGQDQQKVTTAKAVPGEAEMTNAKNTRDATTEGVWLWKATAKGNPDAPVQLAELYISGNGVPQSCEQAVVLLKTAAIKDNARACNRLASLYANGTCVPRDRVKAYHWLRSALAGDPNNQGAQRNRDLLWQQMTPEERTLAQRDQ